MKKEMTLARRGFLLLGAALTACAQAPVPRTADAAWPALPALRLAPALLGSQRFALSQRLTVFRLDAPAADPQTVDVQLQAEAEGLLLAGFAIGQRVLLMRWDGQELQVQRHPRLPAEVDTDRMLRDLCLVFWPAAALAGALPPPWRLQDDERQGRALWCGERLALRIQQQGQLSGDSRVELINHAEGYRLLIESRPQEGS